MDDRECIIALNTVGTIGGARLARLLARFGSARDVLTASESALLGVRGIGPDTARAIPELRDGRRLAWELERASELGVQIVTSADADYPERLLSIDHPPPVLYVRGQLIPADALAVSIVGTRRPTRYGLTVAGLLAGRAADAGFTVVSGLARGIDSASHRGALARGGRTLAVLGCGIDIIYPPENAKLACEIAGNGALLSERSLGSPPLGRNFPARNRIISGLSLGVVVVEAGETSGALITADFALEQGREVFAVPGQILSPASRGTHNLIKQGARLVEGIEDILEELGIPPANLPSPERHDEPGSSLSGREKRVLEALGFSATAVDDIVFETGLPASTVAATLVSLEIKNLATRAVGGYTRCMGEGG